MIYVAADLARKRRARGLRLNHPEAVALISEAMMEAARDGTTVPEAATRGAQVLGIEDVMEGIPRWSASSRWRRRSHGTKLVSCHDPIRMADARRPDGDLEINAGRPTVSGRPATARSRSRTRHDPIR